MKTEKPLYFFPFKSTIFSVIVINTSVLLKHPNDFKCLQECLQCRIACTTCIRATLYEKIIKYRINIFGFEQAWKFSVPNVFPAAHWTLKWEFILKCLLSCNCHYSITATCSFHYCYSKYSDSLPSSDQILYSYSWVALLGIPGDRFFQSQWLWWALQFI